jgi:HlyD family secretion protein
LDAPATGTVAEVNVKEGQTVKAGQVLVTLESEVLRSDLQQVETKLEGQQNRLAQLDVIKNQLMMEIRSSSNRTKPNKWKKWLKWSRRSKT